MEVLTQPLALAHALVISARSTSTISETQFCQLYTGLFPWAELNVSRDTMHEHFKRLDTDNDGVLSWHDIAADLCLTNPKRYVPQALLDQATERFREMTRHGGHVTREEVEKVYEVASPRSARTPSHSDGDSGEWDLVANEEAHDQVTYDDFERYAILAFVRSIAKHAPAQATEKKETEAATSEDKQQSDATKTNNESPLTGSTGTVSNTDASVALSGPPVAPLPSLSTPSTFLSPTPATLSAPLTAHSRSSSNTSLASVASLLSVDSLLSSSSNGQSQSSQSSQIQKSKEEKMALPLPAVPSSCTSGSESLAESSSTSDRAQSSSNNSNSESEPQYTIHIDAAPPNISSSTAVGLSPLSHLHNDDVLQDDGSSMQQEHKLSQLLLPPQSLNETTGDTHSLCGSEGELLSQASDISAESQDARLLGEFCIVEDEGSLAAHPVSHATTLSLLLPTPSSSTHAHSGDVVSPSTRQLDSPGVLVDPEHAEPGPVHVTARDSHASIEEESKREVSPDLDEPVMAPASIATTVASTTTNTDVSHPSAVSSSPLIISQPSLISTYQQALRSSFSDRDAISSSESEADLLPSVLASDHKQLDRASFTQSPSALSDVPLQPGDAWTGDNSALSSSSFSSPPSAATVERGITLRGSRARVQSLEVEDGDQQRQRAAALQRKALLDVDAREQCACGCIIL